MKAKERESRVKYRYKVMALTCAVCMGLSGCGEVEEEVDSVVVVDREEKESSYTLGVASVNDVVKTEDIRCTFRQINDEEVSFSVGGKAVANIYVAKGDTVKKGQLLAELEGTDRQDEIDQLEYKIARNKLLLSYLDANENYDKSARWWSYVYNSSQSESDKERLDSAIEDIELGYRYDREDYEDAIRLDTLELEAIVAEVNAGRIYAGMDGEVSFVKSSILNNSNGTNQLVEAGDVIVKIIDNSMCLFETSKVKYAEYFEEGKVIQLKIGSGKNATLVEALPYDMENWESKLTFALLEQETNLAVGTSGVITLELERREQVLCIPESAVHEADDKSYVYVLGENDIREVKWIETGLHGDTHVEVISGLTEGETIILK